MQQFERVVEFGRVGAILVYDRVELVDIVAKELRG